MIANKRIRVLVVDDSLVFREFISRSLSADPLIEVAATAKDAFDARDKILQFQPDVMTLDVEMPGMNGIEFLRRLLPQYPIPVIVVSSVNGIVFEALKVGAVDFVSKPETGSRQNLETMTAELSAKIRIAVAAKIGSATKAGSAAKADNPAQTFTARFDGQENRIITIGSSTGGTEAVADILKAFPETMPPILVTQHMPAVFTRLYAERLNGSCRLIVREARDGDQVLPGTVLIAPGEHHMRLVRTHSGLFVECTRGEKVNGHCPSVDVLFFSVSECAGRNAVGVILTGMGSDGARGLLEMRRKGARTIGQDEASCVVYGMPKVAVDIGAVERQASVDRIPALILAALKREPI